jgi:MFS family permease
MTDTDRNHTDDHAGAAAPTSAFAAWRDPNFGRYSLAYVPSMSATWIRITAMGYLVYELTADPLKLGMISFATAIPQLVLSPLSGTFIDRVNRHNLLVTVQLLIVVVMAATAVLIGMNRISYPALLAIAVILGSLTTFDWPVRIALIPSLVPRALLQNAIALNTTMFNVSRVFGPTLAGWLIALVGMTWAFGATALLMLPFPLVLLTIPRLKTLQVPKQAGSGWSQLVAGYRYIGRSPQIAALMLMNLIPNVLGMSYVMMAPAYVSDVLQRDATTLGYLLAVNGVGSFIGTFSVARSHGMRGRGGWILRTLAVFGTLLVVFGLTSSVPLAFASIFLLGITYGFVAALSDTLIQLLVDEAYRGRVTAVFAMIVGLAPGSALLVGWIATMTGIGWAIAIIGIAMLVYLPFLIFRTQLGTID